MAERRTTKRASVGGASGGPKASETDGAKGPQEKVDQAVCPVAFCPVGMALASVQHAGPDVLDHLLAAAKEFLLAARAVIDARADDFDKRKGSNPLERIEIA